MDGEAVLAVMLIFHHPLPGCVSKHKSRECFEWDAAAFRADRSWPSHDVVIMAGTELDEIVQQGRIMPISVTNVVKPPAGTAVRAGSPRSRPSDHPRQ